MAGGPNFAATELADRVRQITKNFAHMTDITDELREAFVRVNAIDRRLGVDINGDRLPRIHPSTRYQRQREGRGNGPRLCPGPGAKSHESRVISKFVARRLGTTKAAALRIQIGWPTLPWLKFHINGTGRLPRCNIEGISIRMESEIDRIFNKWRSWIFRNVK